MNVMKEKEIDTLVTPWVNAQVAYLFAVQWTTAAVEDDEVVVGESNPNAYDEVVTTKDTETIDAFLSCIICVKMGTAHTGTGLKMMTQALCANDGSLPWGLMIQNAYTELCSGSKNIIVVVRNSMAYPQTLRKKTLVVRAVVATHVSKLPMQTGLMEVSGGAQGLQTPKAACETKAGEIVQGAGFE